MLPKNTKIFPDIDSLSNYAGRKILEFAEAAIQEREHFRFVLAGGSTPEKVYQLLAGIDQDWSSWEIYWGDERCLPSDHPDRNSTMARSNWLEHVNIPDEQIYPIPAELGPKKAANLYGKTITDKLPFDLVLLGMGEDGHTASLFPDHPSSENQHTVIAVRNAPKPPGERVSLGYSTLKNTHEQMILVTGQEKAEVVSNWANNVNYPVAKACLHKTALLLDEAAASLL